MLEPQEIENISKKTRELVIELSYSTNSAHLGSSLSCVEILSTLFYEKSKVKLSKLIISKGHAAMAFYAAAYHTGFLNIDHLKKYLQNNTLLWGHPSYNETMSHFIDWSTGSLGHGLPALSGFALKSKILDESKKFACVLSDGELNEGSNWESILFAGHHKLNNIICFLDYNKIQSYDHINDVMKLDPLIDKFKAFHWATYEIDGHDCNKIYELFNKAHQLPTIVICNTIKGKGISRIENTVASHYKPAIESDLISRILT